MEGFDLDMSFAIRPLDVWVRVGGTAYVLTREENAALPVSLRDKVVMKALLEAALARLETYEVV